MGSPKAVNLFGIQGPNTRVEMGLLAIPFWGIGRFFPLIPHLGFFERAPLVVSKKGGPLNLLMHLIGALCGTRGPCPDI